jgi:tetratricopeptide (TPR) repeat protein
MAKFLSSESRTAVCLLSGMAGTGKTALALKGAWEATACFPDGCFYFDLSEEPAGDMRELLVSLLKLLGDRDEKLPTRQDALANLWRSRLVGKRVLVILDNVRSAVEVTTLTPAESASKLLVTSRRRLTALDESEHVHVGVLAGEEADELFRAVGGERALLARDETVRSIVDQCGRLPLAVRVAAARLRSGPVRGAVELAEMLSHEAHRLSFLDDGDRSVTATLSVACRGLSREHRVLLALLPLHPGVSFDLRAVAALADIEPHRARTLLDGLAEVHLVTYEPYDRVSLHDLVRQFARQTLLPDVAAEEQVAAVRRLLEESLRFAVAADVLLTPQRYRPPVVLDDFPPRPAPFEDRAEGVAWLEREWRGLVALCREASGQGLHSLCWQLAFAMREFFYLAKLWGPWIETHLTAAASADAVGARAWKAITLGNLGVAHADRGDLTTAIEYYQRCLSVYQDLDDQHGVVNTISNLAWARLYLGEYGLALDGLRTALKHYRRLGNRRNAAITLRGIALLETELDICPAAVKHARKARDEFISLGLELDVVMSLNCMAWAQFLMGEYQTAADSYHEALASAEKCGSRYETARALTGLGNVRQAQGDRDAAVTLWARADDLHGGFAPVMLGEERVRLASRL